ncbi:MAG: high-affinity branched-chain amino acid transport system permease LivH [candidate division NC10 bacterium CSP1-5]|nr:MAG: high-affinity branched-chain amino acid transport system permease LivH [candidate division NC10 bacterium CSP1-5]
MLFFLLMVDNLSLLFNAPILSAQLLVDGILIGAIFALVAYGMALVWGVMDIINIAQGEFVMLGGYVTFFLAAAGVHPLYTVPAAAAALYILGWALYRTVVFRVVDKDMFISILATFGISIVLQQLANELFEADVRTAESGLGSLFFADGLIVVSQIKVVAFICALVLGATLFLFLKHSRLGRAIRATAQNARAARIMGVNTDRVFATTFALNAAICGAAGSLVVMTWLVHPYLGLAYTLRAFMIVTVAGLGNMASVILASLGLGAAENFAGFVLGTEYQAAFVFSLLVAILVWRNALLSRQRKYLK